MMPPVNACPAIALPVSHGSLASVGGTYPAALAFYSDSARVRRLGGATLSRIFGESAQSQANGNPALSAGTAHNGQPTTAGAGA